MRRALAPVALVALGTVVALFIVEAGLALAGIAPAHTISGRQSWEAEHPIFGWGYAPGTRLTYEGNQKFGTPSTINSKGLREREYDYRKQAGAFRILILGDSFTASLEVPLEHTWHEILESKLKQNSASFREVEVIAAGVQGWGTDQQFLYYQHEGYKYDPDLVILQFFGNDVEGNSIDIAERAPLRRQTKPFFVLEGDHLVAVDPFREESRDTARAGRGPRVTGFLRSHLHTYRLLQRVRAGPEALPRTDPICFEYDGVPYRLFKYAPEHPDDWVEAWAVTSRIIQELKKETTRRGHKFAVVYFPERLQVLPSAWQATLECWPVAARLKWDLDKPNRFLGSLLGRLGISYFDLNPKFRAFTMATGRTLHFSRDGHLNPEGHQRTAAWLREWLVREHPIR